MRRLSQVLAGLAWLGVAVQLQGKTWDVSIPPAPRDNYERADFRCRLPADGDVSGGVVVLIPAFNRDGRGDVDLPDWVAVAAERKMALIGCFFEGTAEKDYSDARRGSGQALVTALRELSRLAANRDLANAKMALWGISSGAQFATSFAFEKPDRVLVFAACLGSYWSPANGQLRGTPGVFVAAPSQPDGAMERTGNYFRENRAMGAYWTYMQMHEGQEMAAAEPMVRQFWLEALALRRVAGSTSSIKKISGLDGWAWSQATGVVPAADVPRKDLADSLWFPTRSLAEGWPKPPRLQAVP